MILTDVLRQAYAINWQTIAKEPMLREVCGWTSRTASLISSDAPNSLPIRLINAAITGSLLGSGSAALVIDSQVDGALIWQGADLIANTVSTQATRCCPI